MCAPNIYKELLPGNGAGLSIVLSEELQIQHVDDSIIIQVCGFWRRSVVAHPDRHGVELIDHAIVINIAR